MKKTFGPKSGNFIAAMIFLPISGTLLGAWFFNRHDFTGQQGFLILLAALTMALIGLKASKKLESDRG